MAAVLRLRLPLVVAALALLFFCPGLPAAGAENTRRVLVLYPTSDGQAGNHLFDRGLRSVFDSDSSDRDRQQCDCLGSPNSSHTGF